MKIIEWQGEIGWELWGAKVKTDLQMATGEDITVRFSSVGGDIFEGADIISVLSDFKRDNPGIKMNLELKGVAASMGSAISSAPLWDEVAVESITAYMIHRPSMFSYGDFEDMKSRAEFLEKANDAFAGYYSDKSGKSVKDIQTLMKNETWYYGQAIVDNGFADRVIESDKTGDETTMITTMKQKFTKMCENQKQINENQKFDTVKASACFKTTMIETVKADDIKKPSLIEGNSIMEVPTMNEEELKKDNPELYNALMKKGADNEREANSARVKSLTEMKAKKEYEKFPDVAMVIDKAIEDGTAVEAVYPLITASIMSTVNDPVKMAAIESPEDITGGKDEPVMKNKSFEV